MGHLDCIYYFLLVGRNLRFPGCDRRRSKEEVIRKGERWAFLGVKLGAGEGERGEVGGWANKVAAQLVGQSVDWV